MCGTSCLPSSASVAVTARASNGETPVWASELELTKFVVVVVDAEEACGRAAAGLPGGPALRAVDPTVGTAVADAVGACIGLKIAGGMLTDAFTGVGMTGGARGEPG
jgi:hypothetical protein